MPAPGAPVVPTPRTGFLITPKHKHTHTHTTHTIYTHTCIPTHHNPRHHTCTRHLHTPHTAHSYTHIPHIHMHTHAHTPHTPHTPHTQTTHTCTHEQSHLPYKTGLDVTQSHHCAGRVSANTRPHQLRWGDREMGTAISCTECSQVAGLIHKIGRDSSKAPSLRAAVLHAAVSFEDLA